MALARLQLEGGIAEMRAQHAAEARVVAALVAATAILAALAWQDQYPWCCALSPACFLLLFCALKQADPALEDPPPGRRMRMVLDRYLL